MATTTKAVASSTTPQAQPGYTVPAVSTTLSLPYYEVNLFTNYAKITDLSTKAVMSNLSAPTDLPMEISFTRSGIKQVDVPFTNYYPARVTQGVDFGSHSSALFRVTSEDGRIRTDYPIKCEIKVQVPVSGNISEADITTFLAMAFSSWFKQEGGKLVSRIPDLMRGGLVPNQN